MGLLYPLLLSIKSMKSYTQFQVYALKLSVRTAFRVSGQFYVLRHAPQRNNNCTPQDLKSGTVSQAPSSTVTAASAQLLMLP